MYVFQRDRQVGHANLLYFCCILYSTKLENLQVQNCVRVLSNFGGINRHVLGAFQQDMHENMWGHSRICV